MAAYSPLATVSSASSTPLNNIIKNFSATEQTNLMTRASRAIETYCQRRLTPFTGLVESQRAQAVDPDEQMDTWVPLDTAGALGMSRAASLGANDLVRHFWVRQYPPVWEDLWTGSITSIAIYRAIAGSQTITDMTNVQYETDTGHVRFNLGSYVPQGSTLSVTYSGGYSTIPDELVQACILRAAKIALVDLNPQQKNAVDIDVQNLESEIKDLLTDYVR